MSGYLPNTTAFVPARARVSGRIGGEFHTLCELWQRPDARGVGDCQLHRRGLDMAQSANKLFIGDNLDVMRGLNSGSVDLIYLDPPFNSKRIYSAPIGTGKGGKKKVEAGFHDIWTWNDDVDERLLAYADKHADLFSYIQIAGKFHGSAMKAYLTFMAQRIVEMHRVLKESGSLYLHCDPTASHYLKLILDAVFGKRNFRNEIAWCYSNSGRAKIGFAKKHDVILFYSKSDDLHWSDYRIPVSEQYLNSHYRQTDKHGRRCRIRKDAGKVRVYYPEDGMICNDWWNDIASVNSIAKERTGYPTQKPLALLDRIIKASSNDGDVVLDPFCGCATTCVAAQNLNRNWIGIDISEVAAKLVAERLSYDGDIKRLFTDFVASETLPHRTDLKKFDWSKAKVRKHFYGEQAGNCNGCRTHFDDPAHFHIDHIYPKSKGGPWMLDNLQLLCGRCNTVKGDRPMEYLNAALKARDAQIQMY